MTEAVSQQFDRDCIESINCFGYYGLFFFFFALKSLFF